MELRLRRSYLSPDGVQVESVTLRRKGPIMFCKHNKKEYVIFGKKSQMGYIDCRILETLFGNEVLYIGTQVLVPRKFFFI
jgi:hypothetical protein